MFSCTSTYIDHRQIGVNRCEVRKKNTKVGGLKSICYTFTVSCITVYAIKLMHTVAMVQLAERSPRMQELGVRFPVASGDRPNLR